MNRTAMLAMLAIVAGISTLHAQSAPSPNRVKLNGHVFTLPAGFEIELVAKAPLVDRPISASFDEQGRLYVTDSSGSNERVALQLEKKPHRIVRLEDSMGDGVFDQSIVFADQMMFPEGALWHAGSLYVSAPPHIWKLTDADGDGKADRREVWFDGKTLTGCANDLHGPWLGPDGWIYWTKGAFAPQTYTIRGKEFKTRASHLFRARPDGTGIEPLMTGGMDNPVGLAFAPNGDRFVSGTFFQFPADGKRDGILHAVYGGIYGKDWDVIRDPGHAWTSPRVMPIMTHLGAAAPCGMIRFESHLFGNDYQDNLFCCLFNMQKVTRHVLIPDGATYKTRDEDFLVSDNKDFHPTDVVEAPDGSLLILDTGGWYKLCCPTSQLVKPDVLGAIYRVRKTGAAKLDDPLGSKIDWKGSSPKVCSRLLGDPRTFVRRRAIATLATLDPDAVAKEAKRLLQEDASAEAKRNALWAVIRGAHGLPAPAANFFREVAKTAEPSVRQVAIVAGREARTTVPILRELADEPTALRLALENLTRRLPFGHNREDLHEELVSSLSDGIARTTDPTLLHAYALALVRAEAPKALAARRNDPRPNVRRAALIALDQSPGAAIQASWVVGELGAADPLLREAAWWIAGRHPEWAKELSQPLGERLRTSDRMTPKERGELAEHLAKFAKAEAFQRLLAERLRDSGAGDPSKITVLHAMVRANLKEAPESWLSAIAAALSDEKGDVLREAVFAARVLRLPKQLPSGWSSSLRALGESKAAEAPTRLAALAAVPGGIGSVDATTYAFLLEQVRSSQPVPQRGAAAEVLSKARLDAGQLGALADALASTGPMELERLLDAFGQTKDEAIGRRLLGALQAPALKSSLRDDMVRPRLAKFGPALVQRAEPLLKSLNVDSEQQKAKLEAFLAQAKDGDVRRGQAVFNSAKTACVACHSIGYLGGKIGPDLTRIGAIRTERDLLESILFPSASFVRSYEPVLVQTTDGRSHNGLIKKDSADELILTVAADKEVRLLRSEIEEIRPGRVSIMPAGLEQQLSARDLADLVAFLRACK